MKIIEIIILVAAAAIVAAVIVCGIIRKKKGKTGCDCGCSGCPYHGACSSKKAEKTEDGSVGSEKYSSLLPYRFI